MTSWSELIMGISQVDTTLNGNPKTLASAITYLPYGGIKRRHRGQVSTINKKDKGARIRVQGTRTVMRME